jgi:hypothetical protein
MPLRYLLLAVLVAFAPATQTPAPAGEKERRTSAQQKINSQLLYEIYRLRGEAERNGVPPGPTRVKVDARGRALVDVWLCATSTVVVRTVLLPKALTPEAPLAKGGASG